MTILLPIIIGVLFGCGVYLMLRRTLLKLVIGLSLISHGTNIILITSGWLGPGTAPFIPAGEGGHGHPAGFQTPIDPLPQALILTAIVISFASTAFLLVLAYRAYRAFQTADLAEIRSQQG